MLCIRLLYDFFLAWSLAWLVFVRELRPPPIWPICNVLDLRPNRRGSGPDFPAAASGLRASPHGIQQPSPPGAPPEGFLATAIEPQWP